VAAIPADVQRIRPVDAFYDYTLAMAIVAFRPQDYVLTGPTGFHLQLGFPQKGARRSRV
jgi:hypothetical protein